MKLKAIAAGASALALSACLLGAAGCSGSTDAKDLQGVWSVEGSEMRLFEAARMVKEGGFDAFTSSLFISPYQQHELMRDVAYRAGEEYGVQFYYQDFRPMFRDGQTRARELGFYIQKYCGCVFSEQERYQKPSRIIP